MQTESSASLAKKHDAIRGAIASLEAASTSDSYVYLKGLLAEKIQRVEANQRTTVDSGLLQRLQGRKEGLEEASTIVEDRLREMRDRLIAVEDKLEETEEGDPLGSH